MVAGRNRFRYRHELANLWTKKEDSLLKSGKGRRAGGHFIYKCVMYDHIVSVVVYHVLF